MEMTSEACGARTVSVALDFDLGIFASGNACVAIFV